MIPLWARDEVTTSELLVEEFRECASCAAKPGSPALCDSCLQNRSLIHRLQGVVAKSAGNRVKDVIRSALYRFWNGKES